MGQPLLASLCWHGLQTTPPPRRHSDLSLLLTQGCCRKDTRGRGEWFIPTLQILQNGLTLQRIAMAKEKSKNGTNKGSLPITTKNSHHSTP